MMRTHKYSVFTCTVHSQVASKGQGCQLPEAILGPHTPNPRHTPSLYCTPVRCREEQQQNGAIYPQVRASTAQYSALEDELIAWD